MVQADPLVVTASVDWLREHKCWLYKTKKFFMFGQPVLGFQKILTHLMAGHKTSEPKSNVYWY